MLSDENYKLFTGACTNNKIRLIFGEHKNGLFTSTHVITQPVFVFFLNFFDTASLFIRNASHINTCTLCEARQFDALQILSCDIYKKAEKIMEQPINQLMQHDVNQTVENRKQPFLTRDKSGSSSPVLIEHKNEIYYNLWRRWKVKKKIYEVGFLNKVL